MKKYIQYILLSIPFVFIYSCSSDDDDPTLPPVVVPPTIEISLNQSFDVARYHVVTIAPSIEVKNGSEDLIAVSYQWSIAANGKDSIISDQKTLQFISPRSGKYDIDLTVTSGATVKKASTSVTVSTDNNKYQSRTNLVTEYNPAPDFSISWGVFAMDEESALAQVQDALLFESGIYLGTFGGYVVTKFDHTVINTYNKRDFTIQTEIFDDFKKYNSPLAIMVAYDANKNGIADADEWYEIAGSEYHKSTTIKDYQVTYFKPDAGKTPVTGSHSWEYDAQYLKWSSNKNERGYIPQTSFGIGTDYYPAWKPDSYTLSGTLLAIATKDVSDGKGEVWNLGTFAWGYGGIKDPSIDISWAIDSKGNKVHLPGIDFVKIYVPTFTAIGDMGYITALFKFAEDLNLVSEDK